MNGHVHLRFDFAQPFSRTFDVSVTTRCKNKNHARSQSFVFCVLRLVCGGVTRLLDDNYIVINSGKFRFICGNWMERTPCWVAGSSGAGQEWNFKVYSCVH
jgi:hypothetical protein